MRSESQSGFGRQRSQPAYEPGVAHDVGDDLSEDLGFVQTPVALEVPELFVLVHVLQEVAEEMRQAQRRAALRFKLPLHACGTRWPRKS